MALPKKRPSSPRGSGGAAAKLISVESPLARLAQFTLSNANGLATLSREGRGREETSLTLPPCGGGCLTKEGG